MRKGIRAEIIVAENGSTRTIKEFLERILEDLAPLIEANKYNSQMDLLKNVVAKGSSADRQRQLYQLNSNFCFVLSSLIDELQTDIPNWAYNMKHKNKLNIKKGGSECA
ncbi:MAG: hypothetical protein IPK68_22110 [Bdellovibrionales bacterium]|nr:hypothetical protein [Bdellovibrionales bacterium]